MLRKELLFVCVCVCARPSRGGLEEVQGAALRVVPSAR